MCKDMNWSLFLECQIFRTFLWCSTGSPIFMWHVCAQGPEADVHEIWHGASNDVNVFTCYFNMTTSPSSILLPSPSSLAPPYMALDTPLHHRDQPSSTVLHLPYLGTGSSFLECTRCVFMAEKASEQGPAWSQSSFEAAMHSYAPKWVEGSD